MICAPNLTDNDIGGAKPPRPYPSIFKQGPQGYIIPMLGQLESKKLVDDSKSLLSDLCAYRGILCLSAFPAGHD